MSTGAVASKLADGSALRWELHIDSTVLTKFDCSVGGAGSGRLAIDGGMGSSADAAGDDDEDGGMEWYCWLPVTAPFGCGWNF